ncbi:nucleoside-diphosphate-sugar epimerase [Elusimicrobium posterum]
MSDIDKSRVAFFDVNEDFDNLSDVFKQHKISSIIHCATNYGRKEKSCINILKTNLIFPIKLLELAVENNVTSFINTDSYFDKTQMSYMYLQDYSLSKKSLLLWLKYFSDKIKIANVILEHIYGETDSQDKFVSKLINEIAIKKAPQIDLTAGEQKRDFIYIDDAVSAYEYILNYTLTHKLKFKNFELGTGKAYSVKEFASIVKNESKSPTKLNFGAIAYREDEIMISTAQNSELINLGWAPKFDITAGIRKYIDYERNK